jgi:hypothetical protein
MATMERPAVIIEEAVYNMTTAAIRHGVAEQLTFRTKPESRNQPFCVRTSNFHTVSSISIGGAIP